MIIAGVDPGLRSSGLTVVSGVDRDLLYARTIRAAAEVAGVEQADRQAATITAAIKALPGLFGYTLDAVAVEAFEYRGYLPRRINTVANMGRLVGRLVYALGEAGIRVLEVPAGEHKAGYPHDQKTLARLLPPRLANRHERDAYLVASYTIGRERLEALR